MIDLWAHDIGEKAGGIQSYTASIIDALKELYGPRSLHLSLKHERFSEHPSTEGVRNQRFGHVPAPLRTGVFASGAAAWTIRHRPQLILSSHPNFARLGNLTKRLSGSRFWTAAHGIDVWENCPQKVVEALRSVDRIVAVSQFTKRKMMECHSIPEALISVLPNTFDARRFYPDPNGHSLREQFQLPSNGKLLLSVGRLAEPDRMKGFDQVIRALPKLLTQVPEAYYIIGGTGPDRQRLERLAAECGVGERVLFLGFVPDLQLADLYRACDAFILASKKEGFGIVFLEALACGLPVIAGNVDASGEPLLGGELGLLVDPDDVNEISAACVALLTRRISQLRDPSYLSKRVTEAFGQAAFQETLRQLLAKYAAPLTANAETVAFPL